MGRNPRVFCAPCALSGDRVSAAPDLALVVGLAALRSRRPSLEAWLGRRAIIDVDQVATASSAGSGRGAEYL